MTVVQIEKPEDTNLGDWFAELRSRFDQSKDGDGQGSLQ